MEKFVVVGGNRLKGTIRANGSKNATLPILAATLLTGGVCTVNEVPRLKDVFVMQELLTYLGAKTNFEGNTMTVDCSKVQSQEISEDLMRKMRASNLVMGPLIGRFGNVKISYPGGCNIGSRPMNLHLKGLATLGANISEKFGYISASAKQLTGTVIHLDVPSVGATENLIMAAVLAHGTTVIRNAAKEPEIVDLQNFLNAMGAKVVGAGTDIIRIEGVKELGSVIHTVIPDRIEAGTHMVAGAITNGDVVVTNVIPEHLDPLIYKLREAGVRVEVMDDSVRVQGTGVIKAVDIKTMPYPGFPTDMQAQMMALMTIAEGTSVISETIFENRFKHVPEFRRMGADIRLEGHTAIVKGVKRLSGACVEATDLRAGAALILAALAAEDGTVLDNIEHIDRGYERIEKKYNALGARIIRVNSQ
ncbi:UDP-N-acetylglucosamine 1-carboxyvinyltransferase [Desulfotomaculum nigrificans CO-1-SRB]|uniref:UDP-N-acetylglucosamine 1-carboxyvinyltransferase n=1 Tax=Desulfotomaculum nigrificans (strain DSM 14880 / VKM B-2319 / CO-1-SRB) TaxID=868595 RepID=F6B3E3_DESCC|nr:UDP-N-acetylglucosamine 1-carboxyvinyltransferase [Desulfotomaculum nigrificans]AEF95174.1 UDP-N-acetylglucosamine 1-carboxyvinyltransferase [Desulfotomaculum nigrificans CO-1-SRB]